MNTAELRIVSLEETSYFLEKKLKDLDEALLAQQSQIDKLEKKVNELNKQITGLKSEMDGQDPINEPPPHYNQEKA